MANGAFWENDKSEAIEVAKEKAYLETLFIITDMKNEYGEDDERRIIFNRLESEIKKLLRK